MKRLYRLTALIVCFIMMLSVTEIGYAEDDNHFELYSISLKETAEVSLGYDEWGYIISSLGNSSYTATVTAADGYNSSKSMHLKWNPKSVTDGIAFRAELQDYDDHRIPSEEEGMAYNISMKIKRIRGSSLKIGGWWSWGDGIGISNCKIGEWVELTHTAYYVSNPDKSARTLMFTLTGNEDTEVYIDDIRFTKVGDDKNLLAESQSTFENIEISQNKETTCTVGGRFYGESGSFVEAQLADGANTKRMNLQTDESGKFSFSFVPDYTTYNLKLTSGDSFYEKKLDISHLKTLLNVGSDKGYTAEAVSDMADAITVQGKHKGVSGGAVTLFATDSTGEIAAVAQTISDAGGGYELKFGLNPGSYNIRLEASGLEQINSGLNIPEKILDVGEEYYAGLLRRLKAYATELDGMIAECESRGISTDYEAAASSIIKEFAENIEFEKQHGDSRRFGQYLYNLTEIYRQTKADLQAYLNGTKEPFDVPEFDATDIELQGKSVVAESEFGGKPEKRPVFLTGFGHFETAREELEFFSDIGMNIINASFVMEDTSIAAEGKVKSFIIPADDAEKRDVSAMSETERQFCEKYGAYINYEAEAEIREVLENAEKNNMFVEVEIGLNFVPDFVLAQIKDSGAAQTQYLPFALDNESVREFIRLWIEYVVSVCDEYNAPQSMVMINEPAVNGNQKIQEVQYYLPKWHKYLEEKYGTMESFRTAHSDLYYTDFEEVPMPSEYEATPLFYEYMCFNDWLINDFQKFLTECVKNTGSDILVSSKVMDYFRPNYHKYFQIGSNYEKISQHFDVNGCDAHSYYGNDTTPMSLKMGWYDYITSVNEMPAWDSETHVLTDSKDVTYDSLIPKHVSADLWNGAIHGRGTCVLWLYDHRGVNMPYYERGWGNANSNFAVRPMSVYKLSETAMDMNRLAKEITAIQNKAPEVGILYSATALVYDSGHMESAGKAYVDAITSGQKVGFVTDSSPSDMHKYKLLIIPQTTHIPQSMMDELKKYKGEMLIIGSNSLKYDEYSREYVSSDVSRIYAKADRGSTTQDKINEMNLSEITLLNADTGERVENTEWSYTEYDGRYLVNVLNYDKTETKRMKLLINGAEVQNVNELRNGDVYEGGIFSLEPYEPLLLSVNKLSFDLIDENGNVLKENIDKPQSGRIRCNTEIEGDVLLALYKNGVLTDVTVGSGEIEVSTEETGVYRIMAAVWDMEKLVPMCSSREIRTEVVK